MTIPSFKEFMMESVTMASDMEKGFLVMCYNDRGAIYTTLKSSKYKKGMGHAIHHMGSKYITTKRDKAAVYKTKDEAEKVLALYVQAHPNTKLYVSEIGTSYVIEYEKDGQFYYHGWELGSPRPSPTRNINVANVFGSKKEAASTALWAKKEFKMNSVRVVPYKRMSGKESERYMLNRTDRKSVV